MHRNTILFGWNRSIPGREETSGNHFDEFVGYLTAQAQAGAIQNFEIVFLDPHGGDLNGFFLITGDPASLDALQATQEWTGHMTRAAIHLESAGSIRGVSGDAVKERMGLWRKSVPA